MRRGDDGGEPQAEAQAPAAEAPVAEELPATAQGEPSAASTEPVQQRQQARAPHLSPAPPPHLGTRAQVEEAMGDMLAKVSRYLAGEVELSLEDYRLMQASRRRPRTRPAYRARSHNHATRHVRSGIVAGSQPDGRRQVLRNGRVLIRSRCPRRAAPGSRGPSFPRAARALSPTGACAARQAKAADLQPQLDQLDQLDGQVGELEAAVEQLDAYSRRLETKFDALATRKDGET